MALSIQNITRPSTTQHKLQRPDPRWLGDSLMTGIVDAGAEGGAADGAPAVPTTITSITIQ